MSNTTTYVAGYEFVGKYPAFMRHCWSLHKRTAFIASVLRKCEDYLRSKKDKQATCAGIGFRSKSGQSYRLFMMSRAKRFTIIKWNA